MTELENKLASGAFVITAEIVPPVSGDGQDLRRRADVLGGLVDAINITDGAAANPAMSGLAACALLRADGHEPVFQLTCRDRNRIGLASDLLGASALGVTNVLVLHGDDPSKGSMPEAKPVFDLDSRSLLHMAACMRDEGRLPSGREINSRPEFFLGCADAPFDPPDDFVPSGLLAKIAAGAQFAQTQFCYDLEATKRYFEVLAAHDVTASLSFIAGIGPLLSARQARFMNDNLYGVSIPPAIINRLDAASDPSLEGINICVELIAGLKEIPGVKGVHIMAPMQSTEKIAEVVRRTGLRTQSSNPAGA